MGLGKDGLSNSVGDVVPNVGSPLQAGGPLLGRDADMILKVFFSLSITFHSRPILSFNVTVCRDWCPYFKVFLYPYYHKYHFLSASNSLFFCS